MIDIKQLKIVNEIVKTGKLTRAAENLFLSQPVISHHLKQLEESLSGKLFHRSSRKMQLTKLGEIIYELSEKILSDLGIYEEKVNKYLQGENVNLSISTECNTSYHWLPNVMRMFNKKNDTTQIHISNQTIEDPRLALLNGHIDLAILIDPTPSNKLELIEIFLDEVELIVSPENHLAKKKFVIAEDFKDQNYIMFSRQFEDNLFAKDHLIPASVRPKKISIVQFTEATLELVKSNIGVTVMSSWISKGLVKMYNLRNIKITESAYKRRWCIAYLKNDEHADQKKQFIHLLKQSLKDI